MEELLEIIVRLIVGMMKPPTSQSRPLSVRRVDPPSRAPVRGKIPSARRAPGRRIATSQIAIAQPIITSMAAVQSVATASTGTAHAVPAKSISATAAMTANEKPSANAASLRKWMTPATLRQQFMVTEILQPPLALRDKQGY